jgi:hypothetical protein
MIIETVTINENIDIIFPNTVSKLICSPIVSQSLCFYPIARMFYLLLYRFALFLLNADKEV